MGGKEHGKRRKEPKTDDVAGLRHDFGRQGLVLTWEVAGCWQHETVLTPTETGSVGVGSKRPRHRGAVPRAAPGDVDHREADAAAVVRELWDERPAARAALRVAGFTEKSLWPITRSRGQPRTPDVVVAAVAVLWEEHGPQGTRQRLMPLGCSAASIKKWRSWAYERDLFDGPGHGRRGGEATFRARQLVADDGREPEAIVSAFLRRELSPRR